MSVVLCNTDAVERSSVRPDMLVLVSYLGVCRGWDMKGNKRALRRRDWLGIGW